MDLIGICSLRRGPQTLAFISCDCNDCEYKADCFLRFCKCSLHSLINCELCGQSLFVYYTVTYLFFTAAPPQMEHLTVHWLLAMFALFINCVYIGNLFSFFSALLMFLLCRSSALHTIYNKLFKCTINCNRCHIVRLSSCKLRAAAAGGGCCDHFTFSIIFFVFSFFISSLDFCQLWANYKQYSVAIRNK